MESVTDCDLGFFDLGDVRIGRVGDEFREVVIVDLLRDGVSWGYEYVLEETFFSGRDVGKPSAHGGCSVGDEVGEVDEVDGGGLEGCLAYC